MRVAFVVPAFQNEGSVGDVVRGLREAAREVVAVTDPPVLVVDDGCTDATAERARQAGALVLAHAHNRGKGRALLSGFAHALALGADVAVSVDADGQHPPEEALRLARHPAGTDTLVLGVRDLLRDGARGPSRFSNAFSNRWMSWFCGRVLHDTQCGLRRYPLRQTLELSLRGAGYDLESEVILKAVRQGLPLVELPVRVIYPPASERVSHFHAVRDPARIVFRILHTVTTTRFRQGARDA